MHLAVMDKSQVKSLV